MPAFLTGSLVLILLQVVVSSPRGADAAGGLFLAIGQGSKRLLDPTVPAVGKGTGAQGAASRTGAAIVPAGTTTPSSGTTPARAGGASSAAAARRGVDGALAQLTGATGLFRSADRSQVTTPWWSNGGTV